MRRLALASILALLAATLSMHAGEPSSEDALRARLPEECGEQEAPDPPEIHKKDPPPTAKSLAEGYGVLTGPLADLLDSAGDVDLVFDTDLCEKREWDAEASGVVVEVAEAILCGEVIEVEVRRADAVDPLQGIPDTSVAKVVYAAAASPDLVVAEGADLQRLLVLLRTRSRANIAETATRPRRGSGGILVPSEVSQSKPAVTGRAGLTVALRDGRSLSFPGHARSGEFSGFTNTDLYPLLERFARRAGRPPPKE